MRNAASELIVELAKLAPTEAKKVITQKIDVLTAEYEKYHNPCGQSNNQVCVTPHYNREGHEYHQQLPSLISLLKNLNETL